jgi:hypothetical protein
MINMDIDGNFAVSGDIQELNLHEIEQVGGGALTNRERLADLILSDLNNIANGGGVDAVLWLVRDSWDYIWGNPPK